MTEVQSAVSVTFFKPELGDFLYASIDDAANEMPLTVLSALTRLNIDPWTEAAELSAMPLDGATKRLAALISRLPGTRRTQESCGDVAKRLVKLLPGKAKLGADVSMVGTAHVKALLDLSDRNLVLLAIVMFVAIIAMSGGM